VGRVFEGISLVAVLGGLGGMERRGEERRGAWSVEPEAGWHK